MSFLDLYQNDQDQAARMQPNEGTRLPSGFTENLHAAWSDGQLFSQSIAQSNARAAVLGDYIDEIRQKTGNDLSKEFIPDVAGGGQTGVTDFDTANARVAKLKESYPELDLAPLSDDEIDKRALAKSQAAHRTYQNLEAGEKTFGGSFGSFLGSAGSAAVDPINIIALGIAPETGGASILSAALRWGALAGVSQAAIEAASDTFKEQVQPGYTESGAPLHEIGGAFVGGAVLGGGFKALGNAWTRVKTGAWPTSVRDAGNVIESEANVADTNIFPGVEGEVAHREALVKTIDDILAGRPVDVGQQITPELTQAAAEAERAKIVPEPAASAGPLKQLELPLKGEVIPDHEFSVDAYHGTNDVVTKFDPDKTRLGRGVFFSESPDLANKFAHGLGTDSDAAHFPDEPGFLDWIKPHISDKEFATISEMHAKHDVAMAAMAKHEIDSPAYLKAQDEYTELSNKLNEEAKKVSAYIDHTTGNFTQAPNVTPVRLRLGKTHEVDMGGRFDWEVEREAIEHARKNGFDSVTFTNFGEGGQKMYSMLDAKNIRGRFEKPANGPQPALQTAEQAEKTLTDADHQDAIRADIDRERAMGDFKVPGVDENGNHTMHSVDAAMDQVDAYKSAAEQIQACAAPAQEAAE